MTPRRNTLLLACIAVGALSAHAEVKSSAANGFVVEHGVTVPATPERVWAELGNIAQWWDREHSYSGDAANLSLEPRAGGCFCERLSGGGSAEHLRVVYAKPNSTLRMRGGLGPLQGMGVDGAFTVDLVEDGDGTRIYFTYAVGGFAADGLAGIAVPVDRVLGEQLARLAGRFGAR